jgi:hypothetical protein
VPPDPPEQLPVTEPTDDLLHSASREAALPADGLDGVPTDAFVVRTVSEREENHLLTRVQILAPPDPVHQLNRHFTLSLPETLGRR